MPLRLGGRQGLRLLRTAAGTVALHTACHTAGGRRIGALHPIVTQSRGVCGVAVAAHGAGVLGTPGCCTGRRRLHRLRISMTIRGQLYRAQVCAAAGAGAAAGGACRAGGRRSAVRIDSVQAAQRHKGQSMLAGIVHHRSVIVTVQSQTVPHPCKGSSRKHRVRSSNRQFC